MLPIFGEGEGETERLDRRPSGGGLVVCRWIGGAKPLGTAGLDSARVRGDGLTMGGSRRGRVGEAINTSLSSTFASKERRHTIISIRLRPRYRNVRNILFRIFVPNGSLPCSFPLHYLLPPCADHHHQDIDGIQHN